METTQRAFLSALDLADRLGVSRRTAHNLIHDRTVPVVRLRGRDRVPAGALEQWITDRENEALGAVQGEANGP
jgi:excisionase family DNA binding protein